MFKNNRSTSLSVTIVAISVLLTSCGGGGEGGVGVVENETLAPVDNFQVGPSTIDVSDASIIGQVSKVSAGVMARTGRGFSFPAVTMQDDEMSMIIPGGPLPTFPARRTVFNGTGQTIEFGDAVTLKYDMFAWSDGALVESPSLFEEAHTVRGGVSDDFPIPEYLAKSLLGRKLRDTVQVVLPVGTADLPSYLDPSDAYVLVVELL